MRNVVSRMKSHASWMHLLSNHDEAVAVKESLEKVIMVGVYDNVFSCTENDAYDETAFLRTFPNPPTPNLACVATLPPSRRLDHQLAARIRSLQFLLPRHFDIPETATTEAFDATWEAAQTELGRMDDFKV